MRKGADNSLAPIFWDFLITFCSTAFISFTVSLSPSFSLSYYFVPSVPFLVPSHLLILSSLFSRMPMDGGRGKQGRTIMISHTQLAIPQDCSTLLALLNKWKSCVSLILPSTLDLPHATLTQVLLPLAVPNQLYNRN